MKMKLYIIGIFIFVVSIMFFNICTVQASGPADIITGADNFINSGKNGIVSIDESELQSGSNLIYNILVLIGMCIAIIVAGILGIKFMLGSAEEKSQIMEALVPFVIGCIVVFGAFMFWKIFVNIGKSISSSTTNSISSVIQTKLLG